MSKNKKNVLKVAKGNYPELPKYAGGGSPVSSPNPQPYTFNPQSVNPGSVATLQSRAQPIDTSGAVQIMQNSDNLAVKNRQLDFEIAQEKARVSKLEGKDRDRAESALMASYSPNIDDMIKNYGLDPKFKRDQELIAFLRQEEKNFKDQQYVVVGKNKGNERAVDSGLAQLQLDFMAKINSNEDIKKQREINAQYAAVDERVKKSQKGTFSQARLYTDLYEKVNDYKNGITDEIPEGTFDLNNFADNSTATEASMLAATNAYLSNAVSGKAVQKDGYQWWSTYYDDSLLSEELTTAYNTDLVSIITADVDFKRKYNIKDGEEATFADKYYKTIRGGEELKFRKSKDKLSKISKDDVDSDGLTAEARAAAAEDAAEEAAKKSKVSNFNIGSTEDEDGNATAGLDIRVEEKRENGTLTGLYDIKYGKKGKKLTDAEIINGKLFLPLGDAESRDFLASGGFLQEGYTTILNNDVDELDESELGKALKELPGFEQNAKGVLIPLTAIEGGDSPTEDSTGTSTGTTTSTELTDTDMENVVFGENENYTKDAGYKHAIEVDKIKFSGSLDDPMKSFNELKPYAKRAVGLLSPFMNEKGIIFTSGKRGEGYAGTKGRNGEGTHQNGEKVDMQFVVDGAHFKNNPELYKKQLEKQESFLTDFKTYVEESGGSVTRTEEDFDDFTYNYTFMKGGKEVTWRGRVHKSFKADASKRKGDDKFSGTSHIDWDFSIGNNTDTEAAGQTPTKSKSGSKSSWGRGVGGL
jgi:hypothetical protein